MKSPDQCNFPTPYSRATPGPEMAPYQVAVSLIWHHWLYGKLCCRVSGLPTSQDSPSRWVGINKISKKHWAVRRAQRHAPPNAGISGTAATDLLLRVFGGGLDVSQTLLLLLQRPAQLLLVPRGACQVSLRLLQRIPAPLQWYPSVPNLSKTPPLHPCPKWTVMY